MIYVYTPRKSVRGVKTETAMVIFLKSISYSLIAPFSHPRHLSKRKLHRPFYKQGFMTDEIAALQSHFHNPTSPKPVKKSSEGL